VVLGTWHGPWTITNDIQLFIPAKNEICGKELRYKKNLVKANIFYESLLRDIKDPLK